MTSRVGQVEGLISNTRREKQLLQHFRPPPPTRCSDVRCSTCLRDAPKHLAHTPASTIGIHAVSDMFSAIRANRGRCPQKYVYIRVDSRKTKLLPASLWVPLQAPRYIISARPLTASCFSTIRRVPYVASYRRVPHPALIRPVCIHKI